MKEITVAFGNNPVLQVNSGDPTGAKIEGQYGTLTVNFDGTYSYQANPNVVIGSTDTFSYKLTDLDGSTSTSKIVVTVGAGAAAVGGDISSLSISESGLSHGTAPVAGGESPAQTNVSFTAGADDLHVTLSAADLNLSLSWSVSSDGQHVYGSQSGSVVVEFDITSGSTIKAGTSGQTTVTETLYGAINGDTASKDGSGVPNNLGVLDVVASDTVNTGSVTDKITSDVVDDVPVITVGTLPAAESLSEANLTATAYDDNTAGTSPDASKLSITETFAGAFHDNFGADGAQGGVTDPVNNPNNTTYSLVLNGTGPVQSNLTDALTQHPVYLVQTDADTITGYAGYPTGTNTPVVFTISTDNAGNVTFTLDRSVENDGTTVSLPSSSVMLQQTVEDGDGTHSTPASINIGSQLQITDDTPTLTSINNAAGVPLGADGITVDAANPSVSGTWTGSFGADGPNSTAPFEVTIGGIEIDSSNPQSVELLLNGKTVMLDAEPRPSP